MTYCCQHFFAILEASTEKSGILMNWNETYGPGSQPDSEAISRYVGCPYWNELITYLELTYGAAGRTEYSRCSGKPGWNVKYRKGSRGICTLYPDEGYFTCLVSIGSKAADKAEPALLACTPYVRELYAQAPPYNGGRWLMIEVTDPAILQDVKTLIAVRMDTKKK